VAKYYQKISVASRKPGRKEICSDISAKNPNAWKERATGDET
jgi:hypothetical protein